MVTHNVVWDSSCPLCLGPGAELQRDQVDKFGQVKVLCCHLGPEPSRCRIVSWVAKPRHAKLPTTAAWEQPLHGARARVGSSLASAAPVSAVHAPAGAPASPFQLYAGSIVERRKVGGSSESLPGMAK